MEGMVAMPNKWYQSYGSVDVNYALWLQLGYCCVATMESFSSAVRFVIEKFDGRMFFGLWQVQVKNVLIQSGLHKMREVWSYCPGGASLAKGSKVADVASLADGYDDIL
ncbi:hypothetical protein PIB30_036216 [Stylosanthes scabra]|uniref:Uncharacterized protein n=1 Tax=Stylosanthes scabra TaxID=79078 RepID=A0ABU6UG25_9FABA|nr:hypothetical protein [Stylosanthes scabra]